MGMEVVAGGQASRLFPGRGQVSSSHSRAKPQFRGSVRCSYGSAVLGWNLRWASSRPRGSSSVSSGVSHGCVSSGARISRFSDDGHLRYYASKRPIARAEKTVECESERKKEKKKSRDKEGKRRMKLVRGLADNLRAFAATDFAIGNGEDLAGDVRAKAMAEAAQALLIQLEALTAEEMEMRRNQREERAATRKAYAKMKNEDGKADEEESSSSSSSSSESSSDNECGEVVSMKDLRVAAAQQQRPELLESEQHRQPSLQVEECQTAARMNLQIHPLETSTMQVKAYVEAAPAITASPEEGIVTRKVEVCMGGKCKKSGAQQLVEAFESVLGADGAVSVCKCLGKCRDGPNVRVLTSAAATGASTQVLVTEDPATGPICVGVGLQDVPVIVASYFGDKEPSLLAV